MNLVIEDGRTRLYQWDTDQRLTVIGDLSCEEVHFCHNGDKNALVCRIREEKGVRIVDIPNILLQKDQAVTAYLVFKNDQGMETVWAKSFQVLPRPKPEDYVYTQTEVLNYENLDQRIKKLEEEGIGDAVKEYLAENPIDGSGNLLVVTFTDEDGTLTPSHTYDQIKTWVDNGGYAVLTDGNTWYQLFASKSILYFERVVIAESESMLIQYLITPHGGMDKRESYYDHTTGGGLDATIEGETLVFAESSTATIENETLIL